MKKCAITTALALTLSMAACACGTQTQSATAAATDTPAASTAAPTPLNQATHTPTDGGTCIGDDYGRAPGGYCLYPAKVTWLDGDTLPVDPATLDWTDADAVAAAYVITANTWDSRFDKSASYAWRRAQIFSTEGRTNPDPSDPDLAKGQAEFVTTYQTDSYTSVEIGSITTEGQSPDPLQPDGTWRRIVTYTRTVHTRLGDGEPDIKTSAKTGAWFLTLEAHAVTGQWLITGQTSTREVDVTPE